MIKDERTLNYYFNKGKFNYPSVIGYVMDEIRKASPVTLNEWRFYYYKNVRTEKYLTDLANKMYESMSELHKNIFSVNDCIEYVNDVIFRRTFEGYNKENQALIVINKVINANVELSPKEWDGVYFVDFVIHKPLVGIQLKPKTFYTGGYHNIVRIDDNLAEFENDFNAKTFILVYEKIGNSIKIINDEVIDEINKLL